MAPAIFRLGRDESKPFFGQLGDPDDAERERILESLRDLSSALEANPELRFVLRRGLPVSGTPLNFSTDQMEVRTHTLHAAFKLARQLAREAVTGN